MKLILAIFFSALLLANSPSFAETKGCNCKNCKCVPESNCGCLSGGECSCTPQASCCEGCSAGKSCNCQVTPKRI